MKAEVLAFLEQVWGEQSAAGYQAVAWKEGEAWRQKMSSDDDPAWAYRNRGKDLYFCPSIFSKPKRWNSVALPSVWLYADLDEVDPRELVIPPTLWWETSKGRWQCMWQLEHPLGANWHARVNQKLTYFCHADRNGWPMAKVLRIPGSVSTKWEEPWKIKPAHYDPDLVYNAMDDIWPLIKFEVTPSQALRAEKYSLNVEHMRKGNKLIAKLPRGEAARFRQRMARDRSAFVWALTKTCHEHGFTAKQAVAMVAASPVAQDKFAGRLITEVARTVQKVYSDAGKPGKKKEKKSTKEVAESNGHLDFVDAGRFMAQFHRPPAWAIERIWGDEGHGFFVGEPKTYKTTLVLDLAVSVATGTKFLNTFNVGPEPGHVIFIQEENRKSMIQDRVIKILTSRGLLRADRIPDPLNMTFLNNTGFRLTDDAHLEGLQEKIAEKKSRLVVLDPWYLMAGVDENSVEAAAPILNALLRIKQNYNVGILLVHHKKKPDRKDPADAGSPHEMSGTGALWRWCESLVVVSRDEDGQVAMHTHHRNEPPDAPILVDYDMGDVGSLRYNVTVTDTREAGKDLYDQLQDLVAEKPGITVHQLGLELGFRTEKMRRKVERSSHFRLETRRGSSPAVYLKRG